MDLIENPTTEKLMALGFFVNNPEESMEKVNAMIDRDRTGWRESLIEFFKWSNEDCSGSLEAVEVPLMAINTDHMPTAIDIFKKYVPSFEAKFLSGTGHIMMWDVTEEFNRLLEESIQEIISVE
jgi:pimeloyl-ACP methyl ester carboxylesterase